MTCPDCAAPVSPGILVCGVCHALVHREQLTALAKQAEAAAGPSSALAAWRQALDLLPADTRQHEQVRERISQLSLALDRPAQKPDFKRWGGLAAAVGVLWKAKTLLLLGVGKLKYLIFGVSKLPTLLSMFASFGVYAALWGWRYAAGFILCIYVHEIGHVVALRQFGIAASAPMFIPGFGALVRLKQYPSTPREDARVGIAGPVWGTGASGAALVLAELLDSPLLVAVGATSAIINLFNLLAISSLDGGRAYRGMGRAQRLGVAAVLGAAWFTWGSPMTLVVAIVLLGRTVVWSDAPAQGDWRTTGWFASVGVALTWMAGRVPVL